jgi:hypothetical protein
LEHDVNNLRLVPLSDDVYAKHKIAYFKLKEAAKAAIIIESSSATSDEEPDNYEHDDFHECDCVCNVDDCFEASADSERPITEMTPATNAPAARLVGVETNPGPVAASPVYRQINLSYVDVPDAPLIGVEPNRVRWRDVNGTNSQPPSASKQAGYSPCTNFQRQR